MRIFPRVVAVTAILFMLTGCTVGTHEPVAIPILPACDKTLLKLNHLDSSLSTKAHLPEVAPGPMRFCRFRWDNAENKLTLITDITRPLAPVALLHALSQLKTVNELYGPNAVFGCTPGHGNADVVILRAATGSELTFVEVQRDGCREVIVTHASFVTYIAYMPTPSLLAQLDAVIATPAAPIGKISNGSLSPKQICQGSFSSAVLLEWAPATVAEFRKYQYGGPKATVPLAHVFASVPGSARGAWCGTKAGPSATHWWAVVVGQKPASLMIMNGGDEGVRHGLVSRPPQVP